LRREEQDIFGDYIKNDCLRVQAVMQGGNFRQSCIDVRAGATVSISRGQLAIIALGKRHGSSGNKKMSI
jgi:hypothetical protein